MIRSPLCCWTVLFHDQSATVVMTCCWRYSVLEIFCFAVYAGVISADIRNSGCCLGLFWPNSFASRLRSSNQILYGNRVRLLFSATVSRSASSPRIRLNEMVGHGFGYWLSVYTSCSAGDLSLLMLILWRRCSVYFGFWSVVSSAQCPPLHPIQGSCPWNYYKPLFGCSALSGSIYRCLG